MTETRGSDLRLVCRANGQRVRGRAVARGVFASGTTAYLRIDWSKVHVFDRATGARLRSGVAGSLR